MDVDSSSGTKFCLIECPLCRGKFSDPRLLPCIHTYCLKCIASCSSGHIQPGDEATCPQCKASFTIPEYGIGGLPRNFFVEQLDDAMASPMTDTNCQCCSVDHQEETSETGTAVMFCVECTERLCQRCVDIHRRVTVTRRHRLLRCVGDEDSIKKAVQSGRVRCAKHHERHVELHCVECKEAICMMCFAEQHKSHECCYVGEVADEFRRRLEEDAKNLSGTTERCRRMMTERRGNQKKFERRLDATEKAICERVEELKEAVDREKVKLLEELASMRTERHRQSDQVLEEIGQRISIVDSLTRYAIELGDKGSINDLAQQTNALHDRAKELSQLDAFQSAFSDLDFDDVTFTPASWPSLMSATNLVGKIQKKSFNDAEGLGKTIIAAVTVHHRPLLANTESLGKSSVDNNQLTVVKNNEFTSTQFVLEDDQEIADLTYVNNELYVIRCPALQEIQVYETATFRRRRAVPVIGLRDLLPRTHCECFSLYSLTSCALNNCLYVCDGVNVFKVDIPTDDCVLKWQVNGDPSGLSVNAARNVLVTCYSGNNIMEFASHDGSLVREIKLPSLVQCPVHTVQLTSADQFVVCHKGPVRDVSLIDSQGQLVTSYRYSPGARTQLLKDVQFLTVDTNNRIFVLDTNNQRIIICNSSFSCKHEIVLTLVDDRGKAIFNSYYGEPGCLDLDESRGRLYVGASEKRIFVFDVVAKMNV